MWVELTDRNETPVGSMAAAKSGKNSVKIPGSGCGISSESNGFSMCLSTKFSCEIRFCVVFFAIILLTNKVKNALLDENLKKNLNFIFSPVIYCDDDNDDDNN